MFDIIHTRTHSYTHVRVMHVNLWANMRERDKLKARSMEKAKDNVWGSQTFTSRETHTHRNGSWFKHMQDNSVISIFCFLFFFACFILLCCLFKFFWRHLPKWYMFFATSLSLSETIPEVFSCFEFRFHILRIQMSSHQFGLFIFFIFLFSKEHLVTLDTL